MTSNFNRDIICISSLEWFPLPTRKPNLMKNMPSECKILYIDPPITLLSPFKDATKWRKWKSWWEGVKKLEGRENIYIYCAPPILPFGNRWRVVNKINQWWQAIFINQAAKKVGVNQPIVWAYLHNTIDMVPHLKNRSMLIYDCVDDIGAYEYIAPTNKDLIYEMENALVEKSDMVFTTTEGLKEERQGYNKNIHVVPNAADIELFMKADLEETPLAEDIKGIPQPIIGFVGMIEEWTDLDLMFAVAKAHPEWSLVLVGPIGIGADKEKINKLKSLENVYFLGRKPAEELPTYLKAFSVCINSFRKTKLTKNVSPLKFYEYMATGKPIVSVDMPGVRQFKEIIYITDDEQEFMQAIEKALTEDTKEKKQERLEVAKHNSWKSRVETMIEKIQNK